jgi:two-component system OmpR family response regulator
MAGHILVIEDEPSIYELLQDALEPRGFTLTWVNHPHSPELLDSRLQPDLIFMDLMLPSLDGVKLAAHLRENGFAHTPIVAFSSSRIMLHFARESGLFQECLAKPFELSDLLECAAHYAGRYVTAPAPRTHPARQEALRSARLAEAHASPVQTELNRR